MNSEEKIAAVPEAVPYIVHESALARSERHIKRLWILAIILIVLLAGSNVAWLVYESQFEDIEVTQENSNGYNNYIGGDGDIANGETNDTDQTP